MSLTINIGPTFRDSPKAWQNFAASVRDNDDRSVKTSIKLREHLSTFNATLPEDENWGSGIVTPITFETEEMLTAFMLRWAD